MKRHIVRGLQQGSLGPGMVAHGSDLVHQPWKLSEPPPLGCFGGFILQAGLITAWSHGWVIPPPAPVSPPWKSGGGAEGYSLLFMVASPASLPPAPIFRRFLKVTLLPWIQLWWKETHYEKHPFHLYGSQEFPETENKKYCNRRRSHCSSHSGNSEALGAVSQEPWVKTRWVWEMYFSHLSDWICISYKSHYGRCTILKYRVKT